MADARRSRPTEMIRSLALSIGDLATQGATSGVVHGLRSAMPELDGQVRQLLQDTIVALGRIAHEAAEAESAAPKETAHALAAAAARGALEELEREWNDGGMPLHAFAGRINGLLDRLDQYLGSRHRAFQSPDEFSRGVVAGAAQQLREELPAFADSLRAITPVSAEVAEQIGRGIVSGVQAQLREDPQAFAGLIDRMLDGTIERAGRELARGLAAGLREELKSSPQAAEHLVARLEELAERSAAAAVRGVRSGLPDAASVRTTTAALTRGIFDSLRRPLAAVAGATGLLLTVGLFTLRPRRA
ncbi:hypothetical protein FGE12_29030 [Aggregicoccus sp. 17bor-14]|uniref:hypothetical protein n=1 Tax=Myxococcaceae TaxID=31 RepID=UPI00129C40D7|nr:MULTISPECIES: hypothetical protein [Myxococcaceae]MBF5046494.1 hypothetical protein [Simulacricoccus sp. 17bor-14]MRI92210.1 hypothetical protein [Aggregicoccus sp. 17bor-14]